MESVKAPEVRDHVFTISECPTDQALPDGLYKSIGEATKSDGELGLLKKYIQGG